MVLKREPADYKEKESITEFIGNPLIAALPETVPQTELIKRLMKRPPPRERDRMADPQERLEMLTRICSLHIPYAHDLFIARSLSRCIRWGYVSRNPIPFEVTEGILRRYRDDVTPELKNYLTQAVFPIYGFSVLGISGVGKSCSVLNAVSEYTQVIDHTEYEGIPFRCAQLVWLKVTCPSDGSAKGLCTSILLQMDAALGTHYHSEVTSRISKDVITTKVSHCLSTHHLGVLIIDDIQNLCGAKKDMTSDMLSFLIYLMESLAIPVVMVGTPKVLSLFQQEFQLAKRATGDGTVRMELLNEGTKDWKRFLTGIWPHQYTRDTVPQTPELEQVFFQESVGNPFLCSLLYKLVQDDAITSGAESFTAADVRKVADEKLCITSRMRENMLKGNDEELRRYEYLWEATKMPVLEFEMPEKRQPAKAGGEGSLIGDIAQELASRFGINISQATKLATEAVAARHDETPEEVLGFAVKLCETVLASDAGQTKDKNK